MQPNGSKHWRLRYFYLGKERSLSIGAYPIVSLAEARGAREQAKRQIAAGVDPSVQKKLARIAAASGLEQHVRPHREPNTSNGSKPTAHPPRRSKRTAGFWKIWHGRSPAALSARLPPPRCSTFCKRIEKSGRRETAHRMRGVIGSVFRLAIVTLRATSDPTHALQGALLRPNTKPRAAITDEQEFGGLLRAIDGFDGWPTTRAALQFSALTFARPGEVRGAKRAEINFEKALWRIPPERTKMRRPHDVPLSRQAIAVLREIWPVAEMSDLIFPSTRSFRRPLSDNAFNAALRRMGYGQEEMTAHGFRSTASTILNENGFNPDVIEAALGHQESNSIRRAYNRATYWRERVELMQKWADMLDHFRTLDARQSGKRL